MWFTKSITMAIYKLKIIVCRQWIIKCGQSVNMYTDNQPFCWAAFTPFSYSSMYFLSVRHARAACTSLIPASFSTWASTTLSLMSADSLEGGKEERSEGGRGGGDGERGGGDGEREGGMEKRKEGGRETGREGRREGGRERGREGGKEGEREGGRERIEEWKKTTKL